MVVTCPIAAAAAFSFSPEIDAADGGVCGDWAGGAWGRDCGGFIWAGAAGARSSALAVSAITANGGNRRVRAVVRSVHCISFLRFRARRTGAGYGSKLMANAFNILQD